MKAQSGVFDGIFFLLVVTVSITMMFVFASQYGTAQTEVLNTYYNLNYISALMKSIYYLDVGQLSQIKFGDETNPRIGITDPYYGMNCQSLADFNNTLLSDLVKRDLTDAVLDNKYSLGGNPGISAPGKTALRCALYEFMKPFESAGLKYFLQIQIPRSVQSPDYAYATQKLLPSGSYPLVNQSDDNNSIVTNSINMTIPNTLIRTCDDLKNYTTQLYVVSIPFRIFDSKTLTQDSSIDSNLNNTFVLSFCMWPSTEQLK
ncbi:Uncharacterised protein [uncultured archaeon]|nr:Uncharacterised protein [uncultured archaeon]